MVVEFDQLDRSSRVWIYQSEHLLTDTQVEKIKVELNDFLEQWTSHNAKLYTSGAVYYNRFLVIFVDERFIGAGGCSIDKSVHFIEMLEKKYEVSLLGRTQVAFISDKENFVPTDILTADLSSLGILLEKGEISEETLVFDNLVKSKTEFETQWIKPLGHSWHKRFV